MRAVFYVQEKVRPGKDPVEKLAWAMNGMPRAHGCAGAALFRRR